MTELLSAADAGARRALLVSRAADIVSDCAAALPDKPDTDIVDHAAMLEEAIDSWISGKFGAHKLSAAVVATDLLQVYAQGRLGRLVSSVFRADGPEQIALRRLRSCLLVEAAIPALMSYPPDDEERWPDRFNWHLTLHYVSAA